MFKNNKIILLTLLGVVSFAGYHYFFKKDNVSGDSTLVTDTYENASEEDVVGREFLITLSKLKSLNLDGSIFKDPVFVSLNDFSNPIIPQEVGRNNPFSPLNTSFNFSNKNVSENKKSGN